jgi:hypothetical protein
MFMPRTISVSVDKIARQAVGKDWSLFASLLDHWPEIVGAEYARLLTPVKIAFPPRQKEAQRKDGTLTVRLPKGLAMEFSFKIEQIRERITGYFGYEAISRIVLEPIYYVPAAVKESAPLSPAARAEIQHTAKDIDNGELRGALEAFGESVLKSLSAGNKGQKTF